ncbi:MAG: 30S ribosomal protein S20 [Desulfobacteraceae bacterium]|nr:30S ribosomal protein S20 [Desulfobacteraceae bacterium]
MAHHKSALKRIKQNSKRRMRNRAVKTRVKTSEKQVRSAAKSGGDVSGELQRSQSVIDKAAKKGVIHRKTAARKISRLSRRANSSV